MEEKKEEDSTITLMRKASIDGCLK